MKKMSLFMAVCGLFASSGKINVASATTALEALQNSTPSRRRCPDPGGPVAQAIPSDLNAQIWTGLYKKSEKLGGLTLKEIDSNSHKTLAEHKFVASPVEKKVYLYDYQYRLASIGLTATYCITGQDGKEPNSGKRTVTAANGRWVETEFAENENRSSSETNFGITSKWRKDPEIVRFLQAERLFWIRHANALRDDATEAEVEYTVQP